jgi:uncharacterized membrane protein
MKLLKEIWSRFTPASVPVLLVLIFWVTKNWVGFEIPMFDDFVTVFMAALAGFGVLNNPTNKTGF